MGLTLVIAEKPSVAGDIARALGGFKKDGDFWVGDGMIIGSAVGHLLEIKVPDEYDVKRGKWSFANLPVIPPHFDLQPIKKSASKFEALARKIRSRTVTDIINACDAGREGELIFRYIMQAAGNTKPIRRLWLQSMTKASIQKAFGELRTDAQMKPLEAAARSRSEADWLVGINGTRALTAFNSKDGGFFLTTVGRVQTPTLAIVVAREEEINHFKPQDYWEVHATFGAAEGDYEGVRVIDGFVKPKDKPELKAERIWSEDEAKAIVEKCRGKKGVVTETSRRSTSLSPALFDLTSLQREANARFGFPAKMTLAIAQRLYERHKVLTYPRTDARALPNDYAPTVKETLAHLQKIEAYDRFAANILTKGLVKPSDKRVFDNAKISDHFAIIPTGEIPKALEETEQKIYDLVVRRFMSVFYPAAVFNVTTRKTVVEGETFLTEGKVLLEPGWLEVAGRAGKTQSDLTPVRNGETVLTKAIESVADRTRPPARYTDATLLTAMETAGKKLDDDELRDAMAEKGLGTPATRAQTIEGLIEQKYIRREERSLVPNAKAFQLMQLVRGLRIDVLTQPRLTAEWEHKLSQIEQGTVSREAFMAEISELTRSIVDVAKKYEGDSVPIVNPIHFHNRCPACGGEIVENYRRFACTGPGCYFSLSKHPSGRALEPAEVEELLANHHIGPLQGFMSRRGFPFEGELVLEKDAETGHWGMRFAFEERPEIDSGSIASAPVVGDCPLCRGRVLDLNEQYVCEHAVNDPRTCTFRAGKTILQHEVTHEEIAMLLAEGRTPLITDFISKRTNRPFKSYLVWDAKKKSVAFEFEKREPKAGAAEEGADAAPKSAAAKPAAKRTTTRSTSTRTRKTAAK
ncbi:DNA topoisomerase III [Sutterella sp.]|uniref:DNA topoisomerase III n=1 Tax=Sutterella sp. TaxID=1981025 RepID=UPI0026DEF959|nr:DNA topoisomerase III [Sutterella sp.]MDO5530388.1 DNA topoisomerase III [Sutterella sp.]